jgi:hypothetical protein
MMNVFLTRFFSWKKVMPLLFIIMSFSACKTIETPINPYDNSLYFSHGRKFSTIPFKMVNNLIIIPLRLNKSDTMNFILDTGVRTALLIGLQTGDSLQLKYARKIKIKGLGEGDDVEAIHSFGNRIDLPGIYGVNQDILILLQDVFFFSSKLGMRIHGILGYDIFKNFVVDINYERKELLIRHHSRFKVKRSDNVVPILVEEGKPYVKAKIMSDNNQWVDVKLILDTGASHALSLDIFSNRAITLPNKVKDAYLGRGLNGDIRGKIGRIKNFHLGGFELENILTSFPDSTSLRHVVDVAERRHGNIGAEILKRFHLTFDYLNQRMIIRPNAYFKKPFVYNMSGIEISTPVPGLPLYVISDIEEDSPAERAGLKKGDQLLYLNNKLAFQYSLNEIIALFQSKAGRKIIMSVQRNGIVMRFEFTLEKPI